MFQLAPPPVMIFFAVIFGAIMGSYVNMAAYRLPRFISTVTVTRSFCPSCKHQLAWYDNLPILSYLTLLGRCRYCKVTIPSRYLWVEVLVAGMFGLVSYQYFQLNNGLTQFSAMPLALFCLQLFFVVDMVLLSVVDLEMWVIPVQTTLPWMILGLILAPIFPELHQSATLWWHDSPRVNALIDSFTGIVLGAGATWTVNIAVMSFTFFVPLIFRREKQRPLEGMGDGDGHILGLVGAMIGWKSALLTFFIAIVVGASAGILKICWERFRRWRLGDRYKPWQPVYDIEEQPETPDAGFWLLLAKILNYGTIIAAIIILLVAALLYERSETTWDGGQSVINGVEVYGAPQIFGHFDVRLVPVLLMFCLSLLLIYGWLFRAYLARNDLLPQGDIVEKDEGKKEEVLEGNYLPFGPPLALSALLVALYDPLLRNVAYWFLTGVHGSVPKLPWNLVGESTVLHWLTVILKAFNALTQKLTGM